MGLLAEFIVATKEEAENYNGFNHPQSHTAKYKGLTELELGYLVDITQNKEIDYEKFHDFETIKIEDDGERVTTLIRDDLTENISNATNETIAKWAAIWCTADELQCSPEDLIPVLNDLKKLSQLSIQENKKLYLWNCL